jgi:hypothetical protein
MTQVPISKSLKELNDMMQTAFEYAKMHKLSVAACYQTDEHDDQFVTMNYCSTNNLISYAVSLYELLPEDAQQFMLSGLNGPPPSQPPTPQKKVSILWGLFTYTH